MRNTSQMMQSSAESYSYGANITEPCARSLCERANFHLDIEQTWGRGGRGGKCSESETEPLRRD